MTPLELDKRDFKKAVRGYSEDEVDFFLASVRADYEALYTENNELKLKLEDFEQNVGKYKALESTLNNTLIVAQQTAEDLKHNAEKAAELILEEAKLKAQQRVHQAEAEVKKLALQKEELLKRIQELKIRLRAFLRAQLDLLEKTADDEDELAVGRKPEPHRNEVISENPKHEPVISEATATIATEDKAAEPESDKEESPKSESNINYSWTRGQD